MPEKSFPNAENLEGIEEENQCVNVWARGHFLLNPITGETAEINCKSWKCPKHRSKWVWKWEMITAWECETNPINKIITLTLKSTCTPEQLNRARQHLMRNLRREYQSFEYLSVLEFTSKTRLPHLHILARSLFIPQRRLSTLWARATRAAGITASRVVWIAAPNSQAGAARYIVSYALDGYNKLQDIPAYWTGRKISYSRGFFSTGSTSRIWRDYLELVFGPTENGLVVVEKGKHKALLPPVNPDRLVVNEEEGTIDLDLGPRWK
jgi:hypothetical protein